MDPLSVVANVVTVLQVANSIISVCYEVRSALKQTPWSLTQLIDEVRDLRNVLETLENTCGKLDSSNDLDATRVRSFELLCEPETGPLARCYQELSNLEKTITSSKRNVGKPKPFSKARAFTQVMGWQLKENEAKSSLERIERCKNTILLALTADETAIVLDIKEMTAALNDTTYVINENVSRLLVRIETSELDDKSRALTHWLAPTDPWESHEAAVSAHDPGTGDWFIQSKAFHVWSESNNSSLWLSGFPGSGKTILFANVIMSLSNQSSPLAHQPLTAFFYCDFRKPESQDPLNVLGSLVAQICSQLEFCPEELELAFSHSRHSNKRPTITLLRDILCSLSISRRIVLLIDGVDECNERKELLKSMTYFKHMSENISIFLTSRHELDIQDALISFEHIRIETWTKEVDKDIEIYIDHRLQTDQRLLRLKDSVKEEIRQCLHSKSSGMFRLVQCSLDAVSALRTVRDIRTALQHLPHELGQTYENILLRVSAADVPIVRKILLWLSFTVLPVTLEELHSAIAIEHGLDELDEDSCLSSAQDIIAVCGSLINVTTIAPGHVRLAHLSVKDYLLSEDIHNGPASSFALSPLAGNCELALDCFTYLSFRNFQTGPSSSEEDFAIRLANYPFLRHAATAWTYYLRATEDTSEPTIQLDDRILDFFSPTNNGAFMSWIQVLNAGSSSNSSNWSSYPKHATPLYYAASFGLLHVTQKLIDQDVDLNAPGSRYGGTPLHGAVCRNQIPIIRALLEAGAEVGKSDWDEVTPLHTAAAEGYVECVKLLLEFGADKNALDRGGEKPVDWAMNAEQKECRDLLVRKWEENGESEAKVPEIKVWTGWVGNYIPEWSH